MIIKNTGYNENGIELLTASSIEQRKRLGAQKFYKSVVFLYEYQRETYHIGKSPSGGYKLQILARSKINQRNQCNTFASSCEELKNAI